jgi:glycosyltransferase involved in cell wall biosynthesis
LVTPLVSVVIPSYNSEKYIFRSINSVLQQSYKTIECIVVDDGSCDNTVKIIKKEFPMVKIFEKENGGVSSARNQGINEAKGEWISFLDADDYWKNNKIEEQILFANDNNCSIVYTNGYYSKNDKAYLLIDNGKRKKLNGVKQGIVTKIFYNAPRSTISFPSTLVAHKNIFKKYGLFDELLKFSEDYEIFLRWFIQGESIGYISKPLFLYEIDNPKSVSRKIVEYSNERLSTWYGMYDNYVLKNSPELYNDFIRTRTKTVVGIFPSLARHGKLSKSFSLLIKNSSKEKYSFFKKIIIINNIFMNYFIFLIK